MGEVLTKLSRDHHPRIKSENTKDVGQHIFSQTIINTGSVDLTRYELKCYTFLL